MDLSFHHDNLKTGATWMMSIKACLLLICVVFISSVLLVAGGTICALCGAQRPLEQGYLYQEECLGWQRQERTSVGKVGTGYIRLLDMHFLTLRYEPKHKMEAYRVFLGSALHWKPC